MQGSGKTFVFVTAAFLSPLSLENAPSRGILHLIFATSMTEPEIVADLMKRYQELAGKEK